LETGLIILILAIAIGLYSAINIGANDVANSMATSVASEALTIKQAVMIAAVFDVLGAVLVGAYVANTIRKGLVDPAHFVDFPNIFMIGMLAAVAGSALWVNIATLLHLPVSTTHAIIGGVLGFGLVSVGASAINWTVVGYVALSWVISPVFGGVISYVIFSIVKNYILNSSEPIKKTRNLGPYFVGVVFFVLTLAIIYKGLKNLHLDLPFLEATLISLLVGLAGYGIGSILMRRYIEKDTDPYAQVEQLASPLQVLAACFKAFSHGANDVANAIGPVAAIVAVLQTSQVTQDLSIPIWILLGGGVGMAVGAYVWGRGVMETVGKKITAITPTRGFSAEFGTAVTVLLCSRLGMPVSTTHVAVGNIIGVGFAGGISALNLAVIKKIFYAWILSVPAAGAFSVGIYFLFRLLFG
jgi:PiT family inorganic phosphate transporter